MDAMFLESPYISYGSARNPMFRDFEKWPYGTFEDNNYSDPTVKDCYTKLQEKLQQQKKELKKQSNKQSCPFCKEHKKRPLIKYLQKRNLLKNQESICEENESCENEQEHSEENCQVNKNSTSSNSSKTVATK